MTCLTITPDSAAEAVAERAGLIVTHHPLPFRPQARLTADTPDGRLLLQLIEAQIAVYSPHTAFDSAAAGINQRLAEGLGLVDMQVLVPAAQPPLGAGRYGRLPQAHSLEQIAGRVKSFLGIEHVQLVGTLDRPIARVAVACGSAGEFAGPAKSAECDCLVTGEVRFHTALEAKATGLALVLAGHFASERFAVVDLAGILAGQFPQLTVWASQQERDPLVWL
jgi:dinuclear metal center YbgI/SA1388 family protein